MKAIFILNLENDMLTKLEALKYLQEEVARCRKNKYKGIYIIHGYGSHGVGGVIGKKIRTWLNEEKQQGRLKVVIYGENFNMWNSEARAFNNKYPELNDTYKKGHNPGITIVEL